MAWPVIRDDSPLPKDKFDVFVKHHHESFSKLKKTIAFFAVAPQPKSLIRKIEICQGVSEIHTVTVIFNKIYCKLMQDTYRQLDTHTVYHTHEEEDSCSFCVAPQSGIRKVINTVFPTIELTPFAQKELDLILQIKRVEKQEEKAVAAAAPDRPLSVANFEFLNNMGDF